MLVAFRTAWSHLVTTFNLRAILQKRDNSWPVLKKWCMKQQICSI